MRNREMVFFTGQKWFTGIGNLDQFKRKTGEKKLQ